MKVKEGRKGRHQMTSTSPLQRLSKQAGQPRNRRDKKIHEHKVPGNAPVSLAGLEKQRISKNQGLQTCIKWPSKKDDTPPTISGNRDSINSSHLIQRRENPPVRRRKRRRRGMEHIRHTLVRKEGKMLSRKDGGDGQKKWRHTDGCCVRT